MKVYASTTYLGPGRTRVDDALRGLMSCGLDGVELGSTHLYQDDFCHAAATWRGAKIVHNYCPPARDDLVMNIASIDAVQRRASVDHARACLQFAADIGAELYTVHPGFMTDAVGATATKGGSAYDFDFRDTVVPHAEAFKRMIGSLGELARDAERFGVPLAIETEGSVTKKGILLMETPGEYDDLFAAIPHGVGLNLNLAHTTFAAMMHGFDMGEFIASHRARILAAELSHNDGHYDDHAPIMAGSHVLRWVGDLPDVPLILEFRDANPDQVAASVDIVRGMQ